MNEFPMHPNVVAKHHLSVLSSFSIICTHVHNSHLLLISEPTLHLWLPFSLRYWQGQSL